MSVKDFFRRKRLLLQSILLVVFFATNVFTLFKSILLASTTYVFSIKKPRNHFDSNFFILIAFFIVYFITSQYDGYKKTEFNVQLLFATPVLYWSGKWLGDNQAHSGALVKIFWLIGLALASMTLLTVFKEVALYGFSGGSRGFIDSVTGQEISATVLSGMLVVLVAYVGVAFSPPQTLGKADRVIIFVFFLLGLFAAARMGSRTLLAIGALSIFQGLYLNRRIYGGKGLLTVSFFFFVATYLAIDYISSIVDILSYYQDRLDSEEHGISSAGGRIERWVNSLSLIIANPLGWGFEINGYSHNLWLDTARNGGIPSLTLISILTFNAINDFRKSCYKNFRDAAYSTTVACVGTSYFLLFCVEPILDGFVYVFLSFCCFWGVVKSYRPMRTQ